MQTPEPPTQVGGFFVPADITRVNIRDVTTSPQSSEMLPARPQRDMPAWSRYAGQPIDDNGRHSIALLPTNEGEASEDDVTCTIDYFYHAGEYWRAVVPLDGVNNVFGQAFNFSRPKTIKGQSGPQIRYNDDGHPKRTLPFLNHLQSRFTFEPDKPLLLYPLGTAPVGEAVHQLHDIIYSIEATGPAGVGFNLRDAVFGNLVCAHRFLSTEEMVFERIAVENQYIAESPPLLLEPAEERALLLKSLQRSSKAGMTEPYYLLGMCGTNNCTSNPFQILDKVVSYTWMEWFGANLYRLPISPRLYLRVRGLDTDPGYRRFVREEFAEMLSDPAIRARKRQVVKQQIAVRRAARNDAG